MNRWLVAWVLTGLAGLPVAAQDRTGGESARVMVAPAEGGASVAVVAGEDKARTAWLGITFAPVPEGLNKHLGLEGAGVMVRNVAKDSPADKAGLEQYDVIVGVGGEKVSAAGGKFVERIRTGKPGGKLELTVVRGGKRKTVKAVLGEPRAADEVEWKYEREPEEYLQDRLRLRGKVLTKGPKGWTVKGPWGHVDIELFRKDPAKWFGRWQGQGQVGFGGKYELKFKQTRDGKTIEITRTPAGIEVTKTEKTAAGERTVSRKYKTPAELRKDDPEAYEVFSQITIKSGPDSARLDVQVRKMIDKLTAEAKGFRDEEMTERIERARKQAEEAARKFKKQFKHATGKFRWWVNEKARPFVARIAGAEPAKEFRVDEEGRIVASIRKGDRLLTMKFKDEKDFAKRRPKLYAEYKEFVKSLGDEE